MRVKVKDIDELKDKLSNIALIDDRLHDPVTLVQTNELAGSAIDDEVFIRSVAKSIFEKLRYKESPNHVVLTIQPTGISVTEKYILSVMDTSQETQSSEIANLLQITQQISLHPDQGLSNTQRFERLLLNIKGEFASFLQDYNYHPYSIGISFIENSDIVNLDLFGGRKILLPKGREIIGIVSLLKEYFYSDTSIGGNKYSDDFDRKTLTPLENALEVVNRIKDLSNENILNIVLLFQPVEPNIYNYTLIKYNFMDVNDSSLIIPVEDFKKEEDVSKLNFNTIVFGNFSKEILNNDNLYKVVLPPTSLEETKNIIQKISNVVTDTKLKEELNQIDSRLLQGIRRSLLLKLSDPRITAKDYESLNFTKDYEDFIQIIEPSKPGEQVLLYDDFTKWVQPPEKNSTNFYLLVGPPGTGKTTLGKTIPYLLDRNKPFPLINLKTLGRPFPLMDSKYENFFELLLGLKECVLFIDEIDKKMSQQNFVVDLYSLLDKKQKELVVIGTANTIEELEKNEYLQGILSRSKLLVVDYPNKEMILKFLEHFLVKEIQTRSNGDITYPDTDIIVDSLYHIFEKDDNWSFRQIENIVSSFFSIYDKKFQIYKDNWLRSSFSRNEIENGLNRILALCLKELNDYKPENKVGTWLLNVRETKNYPIIPADRKTQEQETKIILKPVKSTSVYTKQCEEFLKEEYTAFYEKVYKHSGEEVKKLLRLALSFSKDGQVGIESVVDALYFNFRTRPLAIKLYLEYGQKFPELFSGVIFSKVLEKIEKKCPGNFFDEFKTLSLGEKVNILLEALSYEEEIKLQLDKRISLAESFSSALIKFAPIASTNFEKTGYENCISLICTILGWKGDRNYVKLESYASSFEMAIDGISRNITEDGAKLINYIPVGRQNEMQKIIELLAKNYQSNEQNSNSIILVGPSGAGKTTLIQGVGTFLAWFYEDLGLKKTVIVEVNSNSLVAGTIWRGSFEQKLENLIKTILDRKDSHTILFIDEMHTVIGLGSAQGQTLDANNALKPFLSNTSNKLTIIGCTTDSEYSIIQSDEAFSRRLNKVATPVISRHKLIQRDPQTQKREIQDYLNRFVSDYEINFKNIESVISMLEITKAFAVKPDPLDIEETIKQTIKVINSGREINEEDIKKGVILRSRLDQIVDLDKGMSLSRENLIKLENELRTNLVGQDDSIQRILTQLSSLSNTDGLLTRFINNGIGSQLTRPRPMAKMFFIGNTGCGKTQTAEIIASTLFENRILNINCGEFNVVSSTYEKIARFLATNSSGVILLDEVDKAPEMMKKIVYPILDGAVSIDNKTYYLNNFIIIATGNYQFDDRYYNKNKIGFTFSSYKKDAFEKFSNSIDERQSWLSRFDLALVFNPICEKSHLREIMRRKILSYAKNYAEITVNKKEGGQSLVIQNVEINDNVIDQISSSSIVKEGARIITNFLETNINGLINNAISSVFKNLSSKTPKNTPLSLTLSIDYENETFFVNLKGMNKEKELNITEKPKKIENQSKTIKSDIFLEEESQNENKVTKTKTTNKHILTF